MTWKQVKFSELVESPPKVTLRKGEKFSFIPMELIIPAQKYVVPIDNKTFTGGGAKFGEGDVIFARITPCLENGKIAKVKGLENGLGFGSTEYLVFRARKNLLDADFLYYLVISPQIREVAIKSMTGSSGRQRAKKEAIDELAILVPSYEKQVKIAAILSTYDDLIENNLSRIQLLEQAARLIYEEWFIRFRFPGHEQMQIIDGLPEGWKKKQLGEIITLKYGKALKAEDRFDGKIPVYGSSGIVGYHNQAIVKGPSIIVGRKGNVGSIYWSQSDFYPIDTVYYIDASHANRFLYYSLKNLVFHSSDSAVPGLNRDYAHRQPLIYPQESIIYHFEEMTKILFEQILHLENYNQKLTQARDLLLPKLMNGEIQV